VNELAFHFLHVERPRPITNCTRVHTEWKRYGSHNRGGRRLGGAERNENVTVSLTPTVYIHACMYNYCSMILHEERERESLRLCFCSTLEERAHRLFQSKGVPLESLDTSLFAKSKSAQSRDPKKQKEIALLEAQIYRYTELLGVCCFLFS
jgi:hypothetical protein